MMHVLIINFILLGNDYNKEFSNYLLAKRLIDISNRDLVKFFCLF